MLVDREDMRRDKSQQTWTQVLGVGDEVLHGFHHLSNCQVLQDALTHTDYFTHLGDKGACCESHECMNTVIIKRSLQKKKSLLFIFVKN